MRAIALIDVAQSPSNGVTTNVVLDDLDRNAKGHTFETLISRKRGEVA